MPFYLLLLFLCGSIAEQQFDECSRVRCPKVEECPSDSYRLPTSVHQESNDCCPIVEKCRCNPGLVCPKPECPTGWVGKLILNATGQPGNCCPLLECSPSQLTEKKVCSYEGEEYEPGESWTHQEEECTECSCSIDGVVTCQRIKCDVPAECGLARAPPNSCCPLCVGCLTSSGKAYNNSEVWEEDACTLCECQEGRVKCHAAMCQAKCENPIHIPGECCPRCEPEDFERLMDCPRVQCDGKHCPHGFLVDPEGCPTCKCNKCSTLTLDCHLDCPVGYELDEHGCPLCACQDRGNRFGERRPQDMAPSDLKLRRAHSSSGESHKKSGRYMEEKVESLLDMRLERKSKKVGSGKNCETIDDHGIVLRADGDEWTDGCRHCMCKSGVEMCSLITCSPPVCEHPVFYPGDCCPRCPNEEVSTLDESVDITVCPSTTSDPAPHLDGELWNLTSCLTCTCHRGLILCSAPTCPPAPCESPLTTTSTGHNCCPKCSSPNPHPDAQDADTTEILGNAPHWIHKIGITNPPSPLSAKRNCFSDDSHTEYVHGDTWKVGQCQSCVCLDGKIECFSSSGNCPRLNCDRPVLAKNQCCPICLDGGEKTKTEMNCTLSGSNDTWSHGQSWTLDKCTRCLCNAPLVQCTRIVCSISCNKPLLYLENECCPLCPTSNEDEDQSELMRRKSVDLLQRSGGLEPYCAIVIAALLCTTSVLALYVLRLIYRRRRRRRLNDKSLNPTKDYCYFNNNKKYECSSSLGSTESAATEKKLLCPTV